MKYFAKLTQEDGQWLVEFPDCPGCQTFGKTKLEALEMAREALEGWLETSLLHGDVPPHPRPRRGTPVWVRPRLEVAIQIRWLRDELRLTQGQLAKRVGVSQQQIAKLENPDANPTIGTLEALAQNADARLTISFSRDKN
jgi:predicted RNase H-like HicB family nuclease/DNA-binding XRE family transcriptional regulator